MVECLAWILNCLYKESFQFLICKLYLHFKRTANSAEWYRYYVLFQRSHSLVDKMHEISKLWSGFGGKFTSIIFFHLILNKSCKSNCNANTFRCGWVVQYWTHTQPHPRHLTNPPGIVPYPNPSTNAPQPSTHPWGKSAQNAVITKIEECIHLSPILLATFRNAITGFCSLGSVVIGIHVYS